MTAMRVPRSGFTTIAPRIRPVSQPAALARKARSASSQYAKYRSSNRPTSSSTVRRTIIRVPCGCPAGSQPSSTAAAARIPPK